MKIFIIGLGVIGASYAEKLSEKGHQLFGYDHDITTFNQAKKLKIIDSTSTIESLKETDVIISALYPEETVTFYQTYAHLMNPNQILTDVCGIKTWLLKELEHVLPNNLVYTSHHPMAGKEKTGFYARDKNLFNQANFLIIKSSRSTKHAITQLSTIANDLNCKPVSILTAEAHDEMIAYTSQLTHLLATSLINSTEPNNYALATGDSFKDLTRIAKINAPLWTELFLKNKSALLQKIKQFKTALETIENNLENEDEEAIIKNLNQAKKRRESYD